jgi:hypothetical protein
MIGAVNISTTAVAGQVSGDAGETGRTFVLVEVGTSAAISNPTTFAIFTTSTASMHHYPYHCDGIEKVQQTLPVLRVVFLASDTQFPIGPATIPLSTVTKVWMILVLTILSCMAMSIASFTVSTLYGLRLGSILVSATIGRRSLLLIL